MGCRYSASQLQSKTVASKETAFSLKEEKCSDYVYSYKLWGMRLYGGGVEGGTE